MPGRHFHYIWEWRLRSTPEQLWPYVSDTQRFNRVALGYTVKRASAAAVGDDAGVQRLQAHYIVPLDWDEHPFEWEEPRIFSVYRRFRGTVLRDFTARTTLTPDGVGTLLRYEVIAQPASLLGTLSIPIQIGVISRRRFERAFRRIDAFLQHPIEPVSPFESRQVYLSGEAAQRAREIVDQLIADGYPSALIDGLLRLLTHGDDDEVARLRPYALADRWNVPRRVALEACLAATRRSLLDLRWEVVCPMCRGGDDSATQLRDVRDEGYCPSCRMNFKVNFDHTIEVTFRPNAALRRVEVANYCVGGPQLTPHVVAQQVLAPQETRALKLALASGVHRVRTRSNLPGAVPGHRELAVNAALSVATEAAITATEGGWQIDQEVLATPATIQLINQTAVPQTVVIERAAWSDQAVTAAELSTVQAFRDWFASEALRPDVQLGITHLAVLFTDLRGSTQLYRLIGDAPAFGRVLEHFDLLRRTVADHDGALIKTIGDAVMAAFLDPAAGVTAALEILRGMAELNRSRADYPLRLKLGLHAGPAIAVTLNERLDYFGTTVNIASRLEGQAHGDDLVISAEACRDPGVQRVLKDAQAWIEEFNTQLKGFVDEEFTLYRVKLPDG
jgi:class 3 adenylate cyclase